MCSRQDYDVSKLTNYSQTIDNSPFMSKNITRKQCLILSDYVGIWGNNPVPYIPK